MKINWISVATWKFVKRWPLVENDEKIEWEGHNEFKIPSCYLIRKCYTENSSAACSNKQVYLPANVSLRISLTLVSVQKIVDVIVPILLF